MYTARSDTDLSDCERACPVCARQIISDTNGLLRLLTPVVTLAPVDKSAGAFSYEEVLRQGEVHSAKSDLDSRQPRDIDRLRQPLHGGDAFFQVAADLFDGLYAVRDGVQVVAVDVQPLSQQVARDLHVRDRGHHVIDDKGLIRAESAAVQRR